MGLADNHERDLSQLELVRRYIQEQRYKQAYTILQELLAATQSDPSSDRAMMTSNVLDDLNTRTAQEIRQARLWLDQALSAPASAFEVDEAEKALDAWDNALVSGTDPNLATYRRRVREFAEQTIVQQVIDECATLWDNAIKLENEGEVSGQILLSQYYDRARDRAMEVSGQYPNNPDLISLVARAERLREDMGSRVAIYTSALQDQLFKEMLDDLRERNPEDRVPRQDAQGKAKGWTTVREALEELRTKAREWAASQARLYLDTADENLRKHNPRAAQSALLKRKQIEEYLEEVQIEQLDTVQAEIDQEIERLSRAEQEAARSLAMLEEENDPLAAWQIYKAAEELFQWSPQVQDAHDSIVRGLRNHLQVVLDQAEAALTAKTMDKVQSLNDHAQRQYKGKDIALDVLLERLKEYAAQAREYESSIQQARQALARLKGITDPHQAQQGLDKLLNDFPPLVLEDLEELPAIRGQIMGRVNIREQIEMLKSAIDAAQVRDVQDAIVTAEATLDQATQRTDREALSQLIADMRGHLLFLEAQRNYGLGQYDAARQQFTEVAAIPNHSDQLDAENQLAQLDADVGHSAEIQAQLDAQEKRLREHPQEVFGALKDLKAVTTDQMHQRQRIMNQARTKWLTSIQTQMRKWEQSDTIPLGEAQDALDALRGELGRPDLYEQWAGRIGHLMEAQQARNAMALGTADAVAKAIEHWKRAREQAIAANARHKIRETYEQEYDAARLQHTELRLLQADQRVTNSSASEMRAALDFVRQVQREVSTVAEDYPQDPAMYIRLAKLAFLLAQAADRTRDRAENFERMNNNAQRAIDLLNGSGNQSDLLEIARELKTQAMTGLQLADHMAEVERLIGPERAIGELGHARQLWEKELAPYIDQGFPHLRQWWNSLRSQTLEALRSKAGSPGSRIDLSHFQPLAKVLVLDQTDERAQNMLMDLGGLVARLQIEEVKPLLDEAKRPQRIMAENGTNILAQQQADMTMALDTLSTIAQLAREFSTHPDFSKQITRIEVAPQMRELERELSTLKDLSAQLDEMRNQVVRERTTGTFAESKRQIDHITRTFSEYLQHPAYLALKAYRDELIAERQELVNRLNSIRDAVTMENYAGAASQMRVFERDNVAFGKLDDYDLRDTFTVTDPRTHDKYVSWDAVLEFAENASRLLLKLIAFAEPFNAQEITGIDHIAGQRDVVDWAGYYAPAIKGAIGQGDFAGADALLAEAYNGPVGSNFYGLNEACRIIQEPPYVAEPSPSEKIAADTPQKRYQLAMAYSRTVQGERILKWLRDHRLPMYELYLHEHESLFELRQRAEGEWQHGRQLWQAAIGAIGHTLDEAGGLNKPVKGHLKKALASSVESAREAYRVCQRVCPQHPLLTEMIDMDRGLWLYQQACEKAGVPAF